MRMVMDSIHAVDLQYQVNINWPYCKKKRVRKARAAAEPEPERTWIEPPGILLYDIVYDIINIIISVVYIRSYMIMMISSQPG